MNHSGWGKVVVSKNGQETNSSELQGVSDDLTMAYELYFWDTFQRTPDQLFTREEFLAMQDNREAITAFFVRGWASHLQAQQEKDWSKKSCAFDKADTSLYQACGLAGIKVPFGFHLPRR